MTAPLSPVAPLVEAIRARLASTAASRSPGKRRRRTQELETDWEAQLLARVARLQPDDPQRGRKAFRALLELALLGHLGKQLINDPQFFQLVDDVPNAMEADPRLKPLIDTAIAHLVSG